jgi:CO/xanthine dehydrogenase Mo-binding subunit
MQAAEVLGIDVNEVHPKVGDTDEIGYTAVSGGSRTTYATGIAAIEAAQDVIGQMKGRAALLLEASDDDIEFADGNFTSKSNPGSSLTFKEVAEKLRETGGFVIGQASVDPTGAGGAFAVHMADVEVDPETGKTEVLRYTAIQDAGKAVHPSYVEGQMQGGVAQGVGYAINEEYYYDEQGQLMNHSLLDYRMPTALDVPMIDTVIVEVANPGHPFGVRGVGEVPIVPPLPTLANAIQKATGARITQLPMNPGRVLSSILSGQDGDSASA